MLGLTRVSFSLPAEQSKSLAEYHVAHEKAEIAAAKECYSKHGGGGHH